MKVSNGIKIAAANKALCYKTLAYKVIVTGLFAITAFLFARMIFRPVIASAEFKNLINALKELVKNFFDPSAATRTQGGDLGDKFSLLYEKTLAEFSTHAWAVVAIFALIQVLKFLLAIGDYVIGVNVNEHMTSMLHAGFLNTAFSKFKSACRYAGYRTIMLLAFNAVTVTVTFFAALGAMNLVGIYALTVAVFLFIFANSFRLAVIGLVLPKMVVENKGAFASFKEALKGMKFSDVWQRFLSYFVTCLAVYAIAIISSAVTFNVALLVTIPLSSVTFISLRFVDYYTVTRKKYYITFDEIVVPKELRKNDENLLNEMDI